MRMCLRVANDTASYQQDLVKQKTDNPSKKIVR